MKKFAILILALFCVIFTFVGCDDDNGETYTVYHSITFVQEGQENIVKKVKSGQDLTDVPSPKPMVGYLDVKWDITDFTNITNDMVVTVLKTPKVYTVTLDGNGGVFEGGETSLQIDNVVFGERCDNLPYPQRDGYKLRGYFYNGQALGENQFKWQIDAENIVLTATWGTGVANTKFKFNNAIWNLVSSETNVTFDSITGTSIVEREIYNGELPKLPVLEPINSSVLDIEFLGWQCNGQKIEEGVWALYKEGETVVVEPITITTKATFIFKHEGAYTEWYLVDKGGNEIITTYENGVKISQCTVEYKYGQPVSFLPVVCDKSYKQTGYGAYFRRWKFGDKFLFYEDSIYAGNDNLLVNGKYWGVKEGEIEVTIDLSGTPEIEVEYQ